MFGTIRRHQKWLWLIIATVTIASFLFYFNPASRNNQGRSYREESYPPIDGKPITQAQFQSAFNENALEYYLKTLTWPDPNSPETRRQTFLRLVLIAKQQELGIQTSTEAAALFAQQRIFEPLSRATGRAVTWTDFVDGDLKKGGLTDADFDNYLRHELGIENLLDTVGLSGRFLSPGEAESMYRQDNQERAVSLVFFSASNYLSGVTVTPDVLAQFYTNELSSYRLPDRVQVNYVKFDPTNFLASAQAALTNLDLLVEQATKQNGTNLPHGAKTPAEAKALYQDEIIRQRALQVDARKAALQFAQELDNLPTKRPDDLLQVAKTNKFVVQTTEPFDEEDGPTNLDVPSTFTRAAFKLASDAPFGGPILAKDGVYVIGLKQQIPAETPTLDSIKAKVTDDYRASESAQFAQQAAAKFLTNLNSALDQGRTFAAFCAGAGLKPESLPPFSLASTNEPPSLQGRIDFDRLKRVAFGIPLAHASPVVPALNGGCFIAFPEKELPVDETKVKKELPEFVATMRRARQYEAFNTWMGKQLQQDPDLLRILQDLYQQAQIRAAAARAQR